MCAYASPVVASSITKTAGRLSDRSLINPLSSYSVQSSNQVVDRPDAAPLTKQGKAGKTYYITWQIQRVAPDALEYKIYVYV